MKIPRAAALLLCACACAAQSRTVYRCLDADGTRVYADRGCHHLGLRGVQEPPPAPSLRLAEEAGLEVEAETGPVAAAEGCPGPTPEALRDAVSAALERREINALSGMYYWAGAGRHTANAVIEHLQRLTAAAPQAVELRRPVDADDWLWAGLPPPEAPAPPELLILRTTDDDLPLARFRLRPQAGCYWLSG